MLGIGRDLLGQFFGGEARACLFGDDGDSVAIKEQGGACRSPSVGWRPFIGADLVELQFQECAQEILQIVVVLHFQCRAVIFSQPELARHGVKSQADFTE